MKNSILKSLKPLLILVGTIGVSILIGYLVFVIVCRSVGSEEFKYHEDVKNEFQISIDEITQRLQGDGLIKDAPAIDKKVDKTITKPYGVTYTATYNINGKNATITMDYSEHTQVKSISVRYKENANSINQISPSENAELISLLELLDEYYSTDDFTSSLNYFNKEYLIDNYAQNKNDNGLCFYTFAPHNKNYDSFIGAKTESEYSYTTAQGNSESTFELVIKISI